MITSWQLLQKFIDISVSPEDAAYRLTMAGAEVESISRPAAKMRGVIVARVKSLEQHKSKANLLVTKLEVGGGKEALCVTAATNLKVGDKVFYGEPGAVLPNGTQLGYRDFDGVNSAGMMLSAAELDLPDVDVVYGILVLPEDAKEGTEAKDLYGLNDVLLDVSITPNRGDLLSILGIARELKGLYPDSKLKPLPWQSAHAGTKEWPVEFGTISLPDKGCLCYHLGLATNASIYPSPLDVRISLSHMGMRPLSNIVDATNYAMLVLGQPLHAFDLNTLPKREITVRSAKDGEKIVTLDEKERLLTSKDMLITSGGEPIALAGVMGGSQTGINDDTQTVVLESASFSPLRVGHTSRRLGIPSEAAFRYARGVDPTLSSWGITYALSLMQAWSGAEIGYKNHSALNEIPSPQPVKLTRKKLYTYLLWGDMDESSRILDGFGIKQQGAADGEVRTYLPPTWRPDITIEEDLIEEVGRFRGYDDAPNDMPGRPVRRGDIGAPTLLAGMMRDCAIARGYVEAITYSFLPDSFVEMLKLEDSDLRSHPLRIANPISKEQVAMRTTLIPGLLNGLKESIASGWRGPVRLFEIGRAFIRDAKDAPTHKEIDTVAGLVFNGTDPRTPWPDATDDLLSVKADVDALARANGHTVTFAKGTEPFGHAGQTADILLNGEKVGFLACMKPAITKALDIAGAVYVFEFRSAPFEMQCRPIYKPSSPFPAAFRDISLLVPDGKTRAEVEADIRAAVGKASTQEGLLEKIAMFDLYSGKGIPAGFRSMAFSLSYRAFDKTLHDEEVDKIHNAVRDVLAKTGYNIR